MNYEKALETLKAESKSLKGLNCFDVFQLNEGVFAHRKGWSSRTKSIFRSEVLDDENFKKDESGNHIEIIETASEPGFYDRFIPTEEDWVIAIVKNKKVLKYIRD